MADQRRDEDLGTWVHSLDREVTSLGREQAGMRSTIDAVEERVVRIDASLEKLIDLQTRQKSPVQLLGAIGIIASIVIIMTVFLELRLEPSELILRKMYDSATYQDQRMDRGFADQATLIANSKKVEEKLNHLDENHHKTLDRLRDVEIKSAATRALVHEEYSSTIAIKLATYLEKRGEN